MPLAHTETLLATIRALRAPGGCPWDRKQTLADAARHLMEEAGELLEAALSGDLAHAEEELADLLYMICFCREILGEARAVSFEDIARLGHEKLVRRHPHVFGERTARDQAESQERWNEVKAAERRARGVDTSRESVLKDLPAAGSPLTQAALYQENAAAVGFAWPDDAGAWRKLDEELGELRAAAAAADGAAVGRELGDALFALAGLARRLGHPPDDALRLANRRFRDRFQALEARYDWSRERLRHAPPAELLAAWRQTAQRAPDVSGGADTEASGQPSSSDTPS
mgnify:FL=1